MVWCLEAYDTEMREARCREYTSSKRTAELWGQIPRIDFTDSGHGVVFQARPHRGSRKPTIRRMDWADEHLRRLKKNHGKAPTEAPCGPESITQGGSS